MLPDVSDAAGLPALDERLVSLQTHWGPSSLDLESDMNTKLLHLNPTEGERQKANLRSLRSSLDLVGRKAKAEEYKGLANKQFGKEAWRVALVGYLAGCWLLRDSEDPPCPMLLANHLSELDAAADALGRIPESAKPAPKPASDGELASSTGGKPAATPLPSEVAGTSSEQQEEAAVKASVDALRASLLVNLAAAALKLSEWRLARTACEHVLAREPKHLKALWRLAKAHEGDCNLTDAMAAASRLVAADSSNKEAPRLLEALQKRKAQKGKMFGSIVERAHAEGDSLYTKKEQERDVSEAMQNGFIRCMARPYGEEDPLQLAERAATDQERSAVKEWEAQQKGEGGPLVVRDEEDDDDKREPPRVTAGEHMEAVAKEFYLSQRARPPPTEDERACSRVLGKAYRQTRDMREEGVRMTLPPNVLTSYVDP